VREHGANHFNLLEIYIEYNYIMTELLDKIKEQVNNKLNEHNEKRENDLNYKEYKMCIKLREIECGTIINNYTCGDDIKRKCMTLHPYNTKLDIMDENKTIENNKIEGFSGGNIEEDIVKKVSEEVKDIEDEDEKNEMIEKKIIDEIQKVEKHEIKKIHKTTNYNIVDYITNNISFLWFYIIEPNMIQILIIIVLAIILTQVQKTGIL
jgi:hypothetical protein